MENQKSNGDYYTPEMEEFRPGFEFEVRYAGAPPSIPEWIKGELKYLNTVGFTSQQYDDKGGVTKQWVEPDCVRVKYLNKEDVESLGWKPLSGFDDQGFERDNYFLTFRERFITLQVRDITRYMDGVLCDTSNAVLYQGLIKNKSELKKLMQQLNII